MIVDDGYDLVSGYKQNRKQGDPLSKTIPTKLFNATARKVSGIHNLHDFNCGLKSYRRDVVKNIEVYGEMHRYIPYLAKNAGFDKIGEKPVHHQARKYGSSTFLQRLSRPHQIVVSLKLWQETYARVWFPWHTDVLHWLCFGFRFGCRQALVLVTRHTAAPCYRLALFLHLAYNDDDWHTVLPRRIHWRPC